MQDEEPELTSAETVRAEIAVSSMKVMDMIDDEFTEIIIGYYHATRKMMDALARGGANPAQAAQLTVSYATGAAVDYVLENTERE